MTSELTQQDALDFLGHAFRNIALPKLSAADVEEIRDGLQHFMWGKCTCADIAGENPLCLAHGSHTQWAKENPDFCELAERLSDGKAIP